MSNLPKIVDGTKLLDKLKADIEGSAQGYWKLEDFDTDDYYNKIVSIYGGNNRDYSPVIDNSAVNIPHSTSIPRNKYYPLEEIELKNGDDVSLEEDENGNIVYSEDSEIINLSSDDLFIKINGDWVRVLLNNIECVSNFERSKVILEFIT